MLALFVLRPYGGTTTFALENAWPRCSLFWSFDCGYTALAWAGYASAYRGFASAVGLTTIRSLHRRRFRSLDNCPSNGGSGRLTLAFSSGLGPSTWHPPILAAGHPGCKIAAPFSCLPGLALSALPRGRMQRKTKTKNMQTDFQPCKRQLLRKTGSSPPTLHPPHCGKRDPDDMHT
jgi:hypothetical protein